MLQHAGDLMLAEKPLALSAPCDVVVVKQSTLHRSSHHHAVCRFLTGAIEAVSAKSGLNQTFLGLIVLPIAGNACEHITAVFVAMKDKMDLAIGVALGSSIQIAIFVIPFMVIVAWCMGLPFYLNFEPFATMVLTLAVIHAFFVSSDGNSNWLLGVLLVATYILIGLLYLFLES